MIASIRIRAVALVVAVAASGLCLATVLGTPAQAQQSGPIQIAMPDKGVGFTSGATPPLLDIADLMPGGSVTGVMEIRNASGTPGVFSLHMINIATEDTCVAASGRSCAGSGSALEAALRFRMDVSTGRFGVGNAPVAHWSGSVSDLASNDGVPVAAGVADGDTRWVRLTASLAFPTGNAIQYGALGFDLQLGLAGAAGESTHVIGSDPGGRGADGVSAYGGGTALTGVRVALLVGGCVVLLLTGLVLVLVGRRTVTDGVPGSRQ